MTNKAKFRTKVQAKDLGPAVALLRSFGISPARIAMLLGASPVNIRQIDRRAQYPVEGPPDLIEPTISSSEPYIEPIYGKEKTTIEFLDWQIEDTAQRHANKYQFSEGYRALRLLLPRLSSPTHPRRMRVKARLHYLLAWFAVHQGLAATALSESESAQFFYRSAYRQSGDKVNLVGFVDTSLIVSLALLLSVEGDRGKRELQALKVLDLAKQAAASAGIPLGSEHFRQRGTLLFRLGADDAANTNFQLAMTRMQERSEARNENQVAMTGKRFLNLTSKPPSWDGANELREQVRSEFGEWSLEYAMNCNTATAAGLLTDSPGIHKHAVELLHRVSASQEFGHQATVAQLLSMTPDLRLFTADRNRWIRAALHTNAFRKR